MKCSPTWALSLEQRETRALLLTHSHGYRVHHRVDAYHVFEVILESLKILNREYDVIHACGRML